jgi:hypothetical protein
LHGIALNRRAPASAIGKMMMQQFHARTAHLGRASVAFLPLASRDPSSLLFTMKIRRSDSVRAVSDTSENENEKTRIGFNSHLAKHRSHFLLQRSSFRFWRHTVSSAMQNVDQSAFPSGIRTILQALTGTSSGTTENKINLGLMRLACVENRTFTLLQRSLQEESSGAPRQEKSQSVCQACLSQHD